MAKHASVLRRFVVSSDDGGMWLEHRYKACDWDVTIGADRITDLMRQAAAHARICDGRPQPRPEPRPLTPFELKMRELWQPLMDATLSSWLMPPGGVRVTGPYEDELLIPADQAVTIEVPGEYPA